MYLRQVEKDQYVEKDYLGNKRGKNTVHLMLKTFNFELVSKIEHRKLYTLSAEMVDLF